MKNRIAIITGASSGIGQATALRLAKKGIRLVLNGRDEQKLMLTKEQVNKIGDEDLAVIVKGEISDPRTIEECIKISLSNWQKLPDIFLASAGRGLSGTVLTSDEDQWGDLIDTNVKGLWQQLKSISKVMLENNAGQNNFVDFPSDIIVIGSSVGRNVSPFNSVYGATKFAAHGVTEALRRELGPKGIRVSLIEPGLVQTGFQDTAGYDKDWFEQYKKEVGPVLSADDVARIVDFIVEMPGNVHMDNISVRPTRQAYP